MVKRCGKQIMCHMCNMLICMTIVAAAFERCKYYRHYSAIVACSERRSASLWSGGVLSCYPIDAGSGARSVLCRYPRIEVEAILPGEPGAHRPRRPLPKTTKSPVWSSPTKHRPRSMVMKTGPASTCNSAPTPAAAMPNKSPSKSAPRLASVWPLLRTEAGAPTDGPVRLKWIEADPVSKWQ